MQTFLENLPILMLFIGIILVLIASLYSFITLPRNKQIEALKEWLKWAVTVAEKELGSGTGQLKLRKVYEMAISQFPWIMRCISFEAFSEYVDDALTWMKEQLESNMNIAKFIA